MRTYIWSVFYRAAAHVCEGKRKRRNWWFISAWHWRVFSSSNGSFSPQSSNRPWSILRKHDTFTYSIRLTNLYFTITWINHFTGWWESACGECQDRDAVAAYGLAVNMMARLWLRIWQSVPFPRWTSKINKFERCSYLVFCQYAVFWTYLRIGNESAYNDSSSYLLRGLTHGAKGRWENIRGLWW